MSLFLSTGRHLLKSLRGSVSDSIRATPDRRWPRHSQIQALEPRCLLAITTLIVENTEVFARVNEPVTSGVPLPQSLGLMNTNELRILDSNNQVVPAQFRVTGRWNSGPADTAAPIRWVEVHFAANVPANSTATYQLDVGGTGNAPAVIQSNVTANQISITTGPARFAINRNNFNLFDTVWLDLDSSGTFVDSERIVTPDSANGSFVRQGVNEFASNREAPLSVVLEDAGPLYAVVRAEGFHSIANGSDLLRYVTRMTFFANQSYVQVDHEIVEGRVLGSGNGELDQQVRTDIDQAGLRVNIELAGSVDVRSRGSQAIVRQSTLNANASATVAQARLTDINNPLSYDVQHNGASVESGTQATRAWQDLSDSRWGLAVGTREFWQKNPQRLLAEQDGTVEVQFPSEPYRVYQAMGLGEQAVFFFHPASATTDQIQSVLEGFNKDHLLATAPPQWMVDSNAFGDLPAATLEAPFDAFHQFLEDSYTQTIAYINQGRAYGLLNYLDMPIDQFDGTTNPDAISWGNSYYDPATAWMDQFARTGERRWLDLAFPYIQHWYTTDAYDTDDPTSYQNGVSGARGAFHRGAWTAEYHYLESLWPYYYLSGDRMALERGVDAATAYANAQQYTPTFDYGTGFLGPSDRIWAQKFDTMVEAWLATGNATLGSQLQTQMREFLSLNFEPQGFLVEGSEPQPDPYVTAQGWMTTHLVHDAVYDYFRVTGDEQVRDFLVTSPQRILQYNLDTSVAFLRFFNNITVDVGTGGTFTTSGFLIPDRGPDNYLYSWEIMGLGTALARAGQISGNNALIDEARALYEAALPQIDAGVWDKDVAKTSLRGFAGLALVADSSAITNRAPTLIAIDDQQVAVGATLTFMAQASDPDNDDLTFSLGAGAPQGANIDPDTGVFTWTPTADQGPAIVDITVRVTDEGTPIRSASRTFSVTVTDESSVPTEGMTPIADNYLDGRDGGANDVGNGGDAVLILYQDGLGGEFHPLLRFDLSSVAEDAVLNSATLTLYHISNEFGNNEMPVTIRAVTRDWTEAGSTWINASAGATWTAPGGDFLATGVPETVPAFTGQTAAVAFDVTSIVRAWLDGTRPNFGLLIDIDDAAVPGTVHRFGSRENSNSEVRPRLQLNFEPQNNAPVLGSIADRPVTEGNLLAFTVDASDFDNDTLAYTLDVGAPAGATIDVDTGEFRWTPAAAQGPGTYDITVRVTDNGTPPLSTTQSFRVSVSGVWDVSLPATGGPFTALLDESNLLHVVRADLSDVAPAMRRALTTGLSIQGGAVNDVLLLGASLNNNPLPITADGGDGADRIDASSLSFAVTLLGNTGNDVLAGGSAADRVDGGAGNDALTGGAGNDTFLGGAGADVLRETADFNMTVTSSALSMTRSGSPSATDSLSGMELLNLTGGPSRNRIDASGFATAANVIHIFVGGGSLDTIIGTSGRDHITTFSSGADSIRGLDGDDSIFSGNGNDTIDGGTGIDSILGQNGDDSILGGDGNDVLFGNAGNDVLDGGAGADRLFGVQDNDRLLGGGDNDSLFGDAGNDTLNGGAGNDLLRGSIGTDDVDGGAGASDRVDESGDTSFTVVGMQLSSVLFGTETARNIERFDLQGGPSGNRIDATQAAVMVILNGFGGNDTLTGGSANDLMFGGDGDDELIGGSGNDVLRGQIGNDSLAGGGGSDSVSGGEGNDTIDGGTGNDGLAGRAGNDVIVGMDGADTILGGLGNDTLLGAAQNDILLGGDGDDRVDGQGASFDTLAGGPGNDTVVGSDSEIDENFTLNPALLAALDVD